MKATYLPRTAWRARAAKAGPGNLTPSRVEGTVIHWPGMSAPIHSYADVAAALRGWQAYHIDDRGWSDIAYQVAVDQAGRAWSLRGLLTQSGANGDNDVNERYGAILLILAPGEEPTEAMANTVREVIADFRDLYPKGTRILPHGAVRPGPTDCPGPAARAAIAHGDFDPDHTTPPEDDDMSAAEVQDLKNFTEKRLKAYADATATFVRQTVAAYSKTQSTAIITAINEGDDALAGQIIDAIEADEDQRAADVLAAVEGHPDLPPAPAP